MTTITATRRARLRSIAAVAAGIVVGAVLSTVADQILHLTGFYGDWGQADHRDHVFVVALAYRTAFSVLGGYVTARLAPSNGRGHAFALGVAGTALSLAAAIATIPMDLGPAWYPIALVLVALPASVLGGRLAR